MQHFSLHDIQSWDRFYRANFINSLSGFKSASLIGTVNQAGSYNLAIFSNIVHLGADPALIGFINRPMAAAPHTLQNIEATGFYTINHINAAMVAQAHQTSARYAAGESEFAATALTPQLKASSIAPFVAESAVQYAMQLVEIMPIALNNTFLVIGAVQDVYVNESFVGDDGFIALEKAGSITSLGIDGYYTAAPLDRYTYAKPGTPPAKIIS